MAPPGCAVDSSSCTIDPVAGITNKLMLPKRTQWKRWHDGFQCQETSVGCRCLLHSCCPGMKWPSAFWLLHGTLVVFSHKCRAWIEEDGCAQQHQRARVNESADSLRWPYYRSSREHSETSLSVNIHVFVIVQANNPCLLCGDDLYFPRHCKPIDASQACIHY